MSRNEDQTTKPSLHLVRGSFQLVSANAFVIIASYLTLIILARITSVEDFGRYALSISFLLWIERITAEAFKHPLINEISKGSRAGVRSLLSFQLGLAVVAIIVLVFCAAPLASFFGNVRLTAPLTVIAADILPFALFAAAVAMLNARDRYGASSFSAHVYGAAKFVFMVGALLAFGTIEWAIGGMAVASTLAAVTAWFLWRRENWNPLPGDDEVVGPVKHFWTTYWASLVIIGGSGILLAADIWMVQIARFGETVVGEYSAAHNLTKIMYMGALALMWPMIPTTARLGCLKKAYREEAQFRILVRLLVGGLLFCVVLLLGLGEWLIPFLFGSSFAPATHYLFALAPAHFFLALGLVLAQLLFHTGFARLASMAVAASAVLYPAIAWTLAKWYGPNGVAIALGVVGCLLFGLLFCITYQTRRTSDA